MSANTFPRSERLRGKKQIADLHAKGKRSRDSIVSAIWLEREVMEGESNIATVFSVSRKKFKRAVDRNLIKRRMREAYRLNKEEVSNFLSKHNKRLEIMFIYSASEIKTYKELEEKIQVHLKSFLPGDEKSS